MDGSVGGQAGRETTDTADTWLDGDRVVVVVIW